MKAFVDGIDNEQSKSKNDISSTLYKLVGRRDYDAVVERAVAYPQEALFRNGHGDSPLHRLCRMSDASCRVLQVLLEVAPQVALWTDEAGWTPLQFAVWGPAPTTDEEFVLRLIQAAPQAAAMATLASGWTPLHHACDVGGWCSGGSGMVASSFHGPAASYTVLKELLKVDPTLAMRPNVRGTTPLQLLWESSSSLSQNEAGAGAEEPVSMKLSQMASSKSELQQFRARIFLLLRAPHFGLPSSESDQPFLPLHWACSLDSCPRSLFDVVVKQYGAATCGYYYYITSKQRRLSVLTLATSPGGIASSCGEKQAKCLHVITQLLALEPRLASVSCCPQWRLPLHSACVSGLPWEFGMQALVQAQPQTVSRRDGMTGLYPFQMVLAMSDEPENEPSPSNNNNNYKKDKNRLTSAFELLRAAPELVMTINGC